MLQDDDIRLPQILRVVQSGKGLIAAVVSTSQGRPALEGVDLLLQNELGSTYTRHDGATSEAAFRVSEQMKEMGFVVAGSKKLKPECIALEAQVFALPGLLDLS